MEITTIGLDIAKPYRRTTPTGAGHDDVRCFFGDPTCTAELAHTTVDGDHGRIETRTSLVSTDIT